MEIRTFKELPDNLAYSELLPRLFREVLRHLVRKAVNVLEKDRVRNINVINIMKNYPVQTIDIEGDSVLARVRSDEVWIYISSKSREEFLSLVQGLDDEDKYFTLFDEWMIPHVVGNRETEYVLSCVKLVYDENNHLPPVNHDVVELTPNDAPYVYRNSRYNEYATVEYVEDRIRNGIALGIRMDGKLVAWSVTHDDGAIGFMNVIGEYRRKGLATSVTAAMVKKVLERGEIPFVHIEEDNYKSMNLALKSGFRKYGLVYWVKLK